MEEEMADPEEVYDDQAKIGGEKEAEDVESSKGSAWPSETKPTHPAPVCLLDEANEPKNCSS